MMDINTTPLIDVMLVLLVMLIVTIPVVHHAVHIKVIDTNETTIEKTAESSAETIEIVIEADGSWLWQGEPVANEREIEQRLRQLKTMANQPKLIITPQKNAKYGDVIIIPSIAKRVGLAKLSMAGY